MKALTREQLQSRKDRAVRFVRDVLDDPERADEIEVESLEDYAERRKIQLIKPRRNAEMSTGGNGTTKQDMQDRIDELEAENADLQDALDAIADIVAAPDEDDDDQGDDSD